MSGGGEKVCWRGREGTAWAAEETESTEQKVREGKELVRTPMLES